jgi:TatD DNase family protein
MDRQHNRVILHWFTGSKTEAKRASDLGCYFSLNPQMLDGPRHREMVAALPFERILTETDAPFSMYRGAPLQPGQVSQVLDTLAELKQMTVQDVAKRVKSNFVTLGVLQT